MIQHRVADRRVAAAYLVCLAVAAAHALLAWGELPVFWGDSGRWLHEVERFAAGETLYRDFTWPFPPLAMWVLGLPARLVGSDLVHIWSMTLVLYLATVVVFVRYAVAVLPRDLLIPAAVATLLWAIAFAQVGGAALPLGMYTPAALVGGLCLITAVVLLVTVLEGRASTAGVGALGLFCALCVLAKQDFWVPAFAVAVIGLVALPPRQRIILIVATSVPVLAGYGYLLAQLGPDMFVSMLGGFGHVEEFGDWGLPSGRRVTAEIGATAVAYVVVLAVAGVKDLRWWAVGAVALVATGAAYLANEGASGEFYAARMLVGDVRLRSLSLFLPAIALAWTWKTPDRLDPVTRRVVMALLVVSIAARARRGFQGLEWYHVLLELPVYVLLVHAAAGAARRRAVAYAVAILVAVGGYLHYAFGRGPLTHEWAGRVELATPRGRSGCRPPSLATTSSSRGWPTHWTRTGRGPCSRSDIPAAGATFLAGRTRRQHPRDSA
jgi:hypothetical protein